MENSLVLFQSEKRVKKDQEGINISATINQVSKPSDSKTFGNNKITSSKKKTIILENNTENKKIIFRETKNYCMIEE